ncbi:hypothetical protein NECID01_1318 [Nematocida sp. AWRm77]|nr:hypothetical protein NECID01_1318 [Nematocida sp. AWRm77]
MNTAAKRTGTVCSLFVSYIMIFSLVIGASSFFTPRDTPVSVPVVHKVGSNFLKITPNLNLSHTDNYNVREIYVYLVHRVKIDGYTYERTIWDKLVKKTDSFVLDEPITCGIKTDDAVRPLTKGEFLLKGSYFHYIGFIKDKTFAEFKPKEAKAGK